ncbi:MAG: hypothetical protein M3Y28_03455 [Armatimonadota bacterium]|nr:hypothetical protein [Armatimonadota bacterium]
MDTDVWAWIREYAGDAMGRRDGPRVELVQRVWAALQQTRTQPDDAVMAFRQAHDLAARLDEPWWMMFCDHWTLQTLLFRKRDFVRSLPLALSAVEKARAPVFDDFPQRLCLQEDLISALQGIDPLGHASRIAEALAAMEAEINPQSACYHCLLSLRTEHYRDTGRLAEARANALAASKKAALASDYHHVTEAYANLCQIAFLQHDWPHLGQWSRAGEMFDGRKTDEGCIAELRMWQAAALRRTGNEAEAFRQCRIARSRSRAPGIVPTAGYFDAWSAFYEVAGDFGRALRVRDRELSLLVNGGQIYLHCQCRLKRARLLIALNQPFGEEAAEVRRLSGALIDPRDVLAELDDLPATTPD